MFLLVTWEQLTEGVKVLLKGCAVWVVILGVILVLSGLWWLLVHLWPLIVLMAGALLAYRYLKMRSAHSSPPPG